MQGLRIVRSRFFWRLYASYSVVVLATAAITYFLVDTRLSETLTGRLEANLKEESSFALAFAQRWLERGEGGEELQEELRRIKSETGVRVTLVLRDGLVIGDSHKNPASMGDHATRPEILEAYRTGFGIIERPSETVGYPMLYVARAVEVDDEPVGVLRVALPLTDVDAQLQTARSAVVLGTAAGLLAALGFGLFVAQRTTQPIAAMRGVAEDLRAGRYDSRVRAVPDDEVGVLADTMNRLASELAERIAKMTSEDERLRAMLAGMVEGVVAVDGDDRIAFANQAARVLLSLEDDDIQERRLWEVARLAGLAELLEGARTSGTVQRAELAAGERALEAHASPFATDDERARTGLVIVLHDVTELRRLERVRRDFVANVSHELKTPLTTIKGFVETLLTGAVNDEQHNVRFLQRIDDNVERLSFLVSDLLSLARIESQAEAIAREPVSWRELIVRAVARHGESADQKGLGLEFDAEIPSVVVLGDLEGLTQVVDNLLENAINYTPAPGEVRLTLSERDGRGVLEVSDTGVGIPPQDLERIFERFYRVDKARSRALGGTGLGLSIVRNLVGAMGGEIHVQSEVGSGTTFTVELPLAEESPTPVAGRSDDKGDPVVEEPRVQRVLTDA